MPNNAHFQCAAGSLKAGEQLFGTASRVDVWFALEVPKPYGHKAFEDSNLPSAVKTRLSGVLDATPNARLQLIKKGAGFAGDGITFFVGVCHEEEPNLYEFHLSSYEDLLEIDLPGIVAEKEHFWKYDRSDPAFLVCTNARRDQCCAKFGLPVFEALCQKDSENVWQTSHLGGHRFAATMVVLPFGATYGRLTGNDLPALLDAQWEGKVHLSNYRGRSCYAPHVQVAEAFLRQESGFLELGRFKLVEIETLAGDEWMFHFSDLALGDTHCVQTQRLESSFKLIKSCKEDTPVSVPQYRLVDYQVHRNIERLDA